MKFTAEQTSEGTVDLRVKHRGISHSSSTGLNVGRKHLLDDSTYRESDPIVSLIDFDAFRTKGFWVAALHPMARPLGLGNDAKKKWTAFERDGFRCWICGKAAFVGAVLIGPDGYQLKRPIHSTDWLTADHLIPASWNGKNSTTNLRPCCDTCNVKRGTQTSREMIEAMDPSDRRDSIQHLIEPLWTRINDPDWLPYRKKATLKFLQDLEVMEKIEELWDGQHDVELLCLLGKQTLVRSTVIPK